MQKTQGDQYLPAEGYTLDGQTFRSWPQARAYLVTQGYTAEDAGAYVDLLYKAYMRRFSERCFA